MTEVVDAVKSAEASTFTNTLAEAMPCSAFSPMSICGMRWAVASNVEPTSDSGSVVIVTSVFKFVLIECNGEDYNVNTRLTFGAWCDTF